jgi:hypothetical protein
MWSLVIFQRMAIYASPMFVDTRVSDPSIHWIVENEFAAIYIPPKDGVKDVIVFWHGNRDQVTWSAQQFITKMHKHFGVGVFAIEYPGYGVLRHLTSSHDNIKKSSHLALRHLRVECGVSDKDIIFVGRSLGCAVALSILTGAKKDLPNPRVMLISPFSTLDQIVKHSHPGMYKFFRFMFSMFPFLRLDAYNNLSCALQLRRRYPTMRAVVIHGVDDELIPLSHAAQVAHNLGASLHVIQDGCTHQDAFCLDALPTIKLAIAQLLSSPTQ